MNRLIERKERLESKYSGNEGKFTYHAGFDYGYVIGKINEIEDLLVEIEEQNPNPIMERYKDLNNNL